ncbi:MAG TPA: FAD-binding oxidoreductase [Vicinamibacterales bacterium]|nr:FAD-binding oxidoreductase [Vicinamibacterales bacterium]
MSPITDAINHVVPSFTGQLLQREDAGYDQSRRVHNGLINKYPTIIARCSGIADIVDALQLARTLGLEVAVRGGGHNVAGRATIDGGLLVDLSPMKGIHVDVDARTARAQGGVLWKEFNRETQVHGLATTGGVVGSTGIAGLTLGGGVGWLMPKYGLALDNLRSADLVMADGRVLHAAADDNADLFWAIRGGGGNFGIAASLEYDLHAVGPTITGGVVVHPLPRAVETLRFFRDTCADLPDEMMLVAGLQTAPHDANAKVVGVAAAHCGPLEEGGAAVRSLKAFGSPVMDALGAVPYSALNTMLDPAFPKGAFNYWKAQFLSDLCDDAIRTLVMAFEAAPSPMSQIIIEHFHGAATRVPVASTACALRTPGFNVVVISQWTSATDTDRGIAWARNTFAALTPFLAPTRYVNYLEDDAADPAEVAYGPNLPRLRQMKTKYDPENIFRQNVNVLPL